MYQTDQFQCSGSMDPKIVGQAFKHLLPVWQSRDLNECKRLEDARVNIGAGLSFDAHVKTIRSAWPVKKTGSTLDAPVYGLPLGSLGPALFLPFMRFVEQLIVDEQLAPIVVYWARHTAAPFLPTGARYRELARDAFCMSIFSEDSDFPPDEWGFLVESRGLCLILYGQQEFHQPRSKCDHSVEIELSLFSDGDKKDEFGEQDENFPSFDPGSDSDEET